MRHTLSRLEDRVERLVEGTLTRWLGSRLSPKEVLVHVARTMEDQAVQREDGMWVAPAEFLVHLNPADERAYLNSEPGLLDELRDGLVVIARDAGLILATQPRLRLVPDESLPPRGIMVETEPGTGGDTSAMLPHEPEPESEAPPGATLIVDGGRHIPLRKAIIGIGRRLSNLIVLDDPSVSRVHAQLRLRGGRYVVYDLGSTSGTWVNDHAITEWPLRAGDVIRVADIRLIYAEEEGPEHDAPPAPSAQTRPLPPISRAPAPRDS